MNVPLQPVKAVITQFYEQRFDFVARDKSLPAKERLLATVSQLLNHYFGEMTPDSIGEFLGVTPDQARLWLDSAELKSVESMGGRDR